MPGIVIGKGRNRTCLDFVGDYKPGDMPPDGYCDWFAWAEVQEKAGLKQERCAKCGLFNFPQELHRTDLVQTTVYRTKADAMAERNPVVRTVRESVCLKCASHDHPTP